MCIFCIRVLCFLIFRFFLYILDVKIKTKQKIKNFFDLVYWISWFNSTLYASFTKSYSVLWLNGSLFYYCFLQFSYVSWSTLHYLSLCPYTSVVGLLVRSTSHTSESWGLWPNGPRPTAVVSRPSAETAPGRPRHSGVRPWSVCRVPNTQQTGLPTNYTAHISLYL